MNKAIVAGLAAGVLMVGLIFSPLFSGNLLSSATAQQMMSGKTKYVTLIASEKVVQVAPDNPLHPGGIMYNAMVYNGTIPGPSIAVTQGDTLMVTLINQGKVIHSVDFHSGMGPSHAIGAKASPHGVNLQPGQNVTWAVNALNPGAFFYHCGADGLNGIWEHIANGMYGGIIVHATYERPAKEFYVVFGEIYGNNIGGPFTKVNSTASFDVGKEYMNTADLELTNGMAFKYVPAIGSYNKIPINGNATVFKVKPGELTRWYIINAGPNEGVSFHFISSQISLHDGGVVGRYGTQALNVDTWWLPPASGHVIETTFPEAGLYVGVDHAMYHVLKGGAFAVLADDNEPAMANDQPAGTAVAPAGSSMTTGGMAMSG